MTIRELEYLMNQYGKDILSFCIHICGSVSEGEELYQEVFLVAMDKLSSIHNDHNPKSYLLGIAVKTYHAQRRKIARRNQIVPIFDFEEFQEENVRQIENVFVTEDLILEEEEKQIVHHAVHTLPEKYKTVILLYYMQELSLEEIASLIKKPKGTVASRLHKAKEILKKELEVYYDER